MAVGAVGALAVALYLSGSLERWLPPQLRDFTMFRDCADFCPEMLVIPAGSYMISPPADEAHIIYREGPLHQVFVQSFAASKYEVTFAQWDVCVAGGGCNGYMPDDWGWGRGNRPVINVSWNDAQAYVQWLSQRTGQRYRLPTSDEWEIAARAGTTTKFSWGDEDPVCDQSARNGANFDGCNSRTLPVGSFQPNEFGLYDMHGNVWEWVEDCEDSNCAIRVFRSGSWLIDPEDLRSANRYGDIPTSRDNSIGFRVARTL